MLGTETVGNRCLSVLRKTAGDEDWGEINSPAPGNLENYRHYWFTASLRGSLAARQRWHSVRCNPPSKECLWLPESVVKTHIRASWNGQKSSLYTDPAISRVLRGRAGSKALWHGSRLHCITFYWALQNHKKYLWDGLETLELIIQISHNEISSDIIRKGARHCHTRERDGKDVNSI